MANPFALGNIAYLNDVEFDGTATVRAGHTLSWQGGGSIDFSGVTLTGTSMPTYATSSVTLPTSTIWPSLPNATINFTKNGNSITAWVSGIRDVAVPGIAMFSSAFVPPAFRPSGTRSVNLPIHIVNGGVPQMGWFTLSSTGIITMGMTSDYVTGFLGGPNTGFESFGFAYSQ